MSGRRPFRELTAAVAAKPEGRERVEEYPRLMDAVLTLYRLREERGLTQVEISEALDVTQGERTGTVSETHGGQPQPNVDERLLDVHLEATLFEETARCDSAKQ